MRKKWVKWLVITGGSVFGIFILMMFLLPALINVEKYRPLMEQELSQALGRKVSLTGDVRLSAFPWAGLSFSGLRVANPDGFTEKDFLSVEDVDVRVKLIPLLSGEIQVARFVLTRPRVVLETDKAGRDNREGIGKTRPSDKTPDAPAPSGDTGASAKNALVVDTLTIEDGTVIQIDGITGGRREFSGLNLDIRNISLDQPFHMAFSGLADGLPLSLEGDLGPLGKNPGTGKIPLDLVFKALDQMTFHVSGTVTDPATAPQFELNLDLAPFSPRKAFAALRKPFPVATADNTVLDHLALKAVIRGNLQDIAVSDAALVLDQSNARFSFHIKDFSKPDVAAELTVDNFDLSRYLAPQSSSRAKPASAPADQKTEIPEDLLRQIVLKTRFHADHFKMPQADLKDVTLDLAGNEGKFVLALSGQQAGLPVKLDARFGPLSQGNMPVDMALDALNQFRIKAKGQLVKLAARPGANLVLDIAPFSPRKAARTLGLSFPVETSDPSALELLGFKGNVRGDSETVSISDGILQVDQSTLRFSLQATDFARPDLRFDLNLDQLDVNRYQSPAKSKSSDTAEKPDEKKTDYANLRQMRLDGTFKADSLTIGPSRFQNIRTKLSAKDGVFRMSALSLGLYKGKMTGAGTFDVSGSVPKTTVDIKLDSVQAGPLLKDIARKDIIEGTANAEARLNMTGDSGKQIRKTLNGEGNFLFTDGAIKGIDLSKMVQNITSAFQILKGTQASDQSSTSQTGFSEFSSRFQLKNGLLEIAQARFVSPFIELTGAGKSDLDARTLDFRLTPKAVKIPGQKVRSSLVFPVLVRGTFDRPVFMPDPSGAVNIAESAVTDLIKNPEKGSDILKDAGKKIIEGLKPSLKKETDTKDEKTDEKKEDNSGKKTSVKDALDSLIKTLPLKP